MFLGRLVYPDRLFVKSLNHFADGSELAVVDYHGRAVAAALVLHTSGCTQMPLASSLRQFTRTCENMWMCHKLIVRASERDSREFDFGRCGRNGRTY